MTQSRVALITGVTSQDEAYLPELLLDKGCKVHGIKRRSSLFNTDRIDHLYQDPHVDHQRFKLHYGDLTDSTNLIRIIQQAQPDEIYNLAAMSHVAVSFETPEYTANADGIGTFPNLHARYAEFEASISIEDGEVLAGQIPRKQLRLVQAWIERHRDELAADWALASSGELPYKIEPL